MGSSRLRRQRCRELASSLDEGAAYSRRRRSEKMTERTIDRRIGRAVALYALAIAAALVVSGMRLTAAQGSGLRWSDVRAALGSSCATLTYDDGFYYLRIAENVAHGWGSTFDGVNATSGYHPLWLVCLVPIFWLTSSVRGALIVAVALQCILMSIAARLSYAIARLGFSRFWAALTTLLWVHAQLPYRLVLSGLEYSLNAVSIFAAIYVWRRFFVAEPRRAGPHAALGLLIGLSCMARLDNLLLFGCIGLDLGTRELRRGVSRPGAGRLLAYASPVAAIALTYVTVNERLFSHALPVTAVAKRDWSLRLLLSDPVYRAHGWWVAKLWNLAWPIAHAKHAFTFYLALGSFGVGMAWILTRAARPSSPASASPSKIPGSLVLFSVLQVLVFSIVYHDGYSFQRWYYVIQPWLGSMLVASIAQAIWERARRRELGSPWVRSLAVPLSYGAAFAVLLASARTIRQWHREAALGVSREPLYAAAAWVGANVPPNAFVGSWNAGTISYLSGRRVINLDGLVNSWEFYETKQRDLCDYWREAGITVLVDTFELNREIAFINAFYSPGVDLSSCAPRLRRAWIGPAYLDTSRYAEAFELRSVP